MALILNCITCLSSSDPVSRHKALLHASCIFRDREFGFFGPPHRITDLALDEHQENMGNRFLEQLDSTRLHSTVWVRAKNKGHPRFDPGRPFNIQSICQGTPCSGRAPVVVRLPGL